MWNASINKSHFIFIHIYFRPQKAQANAADYAKRLKSAENMNADLARRVEELTHDLQNANGDNQRMSAELARLKVLVGDLQDKIDALNRENKQLSGEYLF